MTRNRRSFLIVAAFAVAMRCCATYAQIDCQDNYKYGDPVVLKAGVPEGTSCDWEVAQVVQINGIEVIGLEQANCIPIDKGRTLHVWPKASKYRATLRTVADGVIVRHPARTITIGDVPPPVPAPVEPQPTTPTTPTTPVEPAPPTVKATAATYVYEKSDAAIPGGVLPGLNKLNREKGVVASLFEIDNTDGDDEVPAQYVVAKAAAEKAGLPALVVTAGDKVLAVVKNPKTEAEVRGAVP